MEMRSETSLRQPETPKRCVKGCGFFGTSATMDMCSKCYRDHVLESQKPSDAKAVEKSMSLLSLSDNNNNINDSNNEVAEVASSKVAANSTSNRCKCCNKKVGFVAFKCKCGSTFCGTHRYPEEHKCEFDHKFAGRLAIAKANPLVVADKLQKI